MKVLAVDLDGTLLHPEPEGIPVWGRSGYRYMSRTAGNLLARISRILPVVIATGRNAQSVRRLVYQLPHVQFEGFILENGLVARVQLEHNGTGNDEWAEVVRMLPDWERLIGYESALGLIPPPSIEEPEAILRDVLSRAGKTGHLYRDRHKLFVYPHRPSKLSGVRALGLDPFVVLGDELNDLEILRAGFHAATLTTAHEEVKRCVRDKNGYCSPLTSHAAAEDLLEWVETRGIRYTPRYKVFNFSELRSSDSTR